jgi:hypothetical protein
MPTPARGECRTETSEPIGRAGVVCRQCSERKPATEFRRRRRGENAPLIRQCRQCHNAEETIRRRALHSRAASRQMAKHLAQIRRARSQRQIVAACSAMLSRFGGTDGFMRCWLQQVSKDIGRGGLAAFRHIDVILRLAQQREAAEREARREAARRYSLMPDDELEAALGGLTGASD